MLHAQICLAVPRQSYRLTLQISGGSGIKPPQRATDGSTGKTKNITGESVIIRRLCPSTRLDNHIIQQESRNGVATLDVEGEVILNDELVIENMETKARISPIRADSSQKQLKECEIVWKQPRHCKAKAKREADASSKRRRLSQSFDKRLHCQEIGTYSHNSVHLK